MILNDEFNYSIEELHAIYIPHNWDIDNILEKSVFKL